MVTNASKTVQPFEIDVSDDQLSDLRRRLRSTRWPDEIDNSAWESGTNLEYLRELVEYWADRFDWPEQQRRLNHLPQYKARIQDLGIHFVHVRGRGPNPYPLIVTHGWPSSFVEFTKLIPLLCDPAAHGGNPSDAFDVVAPSMPGYGFSDRPSRPGVPQEVPDFWVQLMSTLGYERFGAHGGDIGGGVSARLGMYFPDRVEAIHVTNVYGAIQDGDPPPTAAECAYLDAEDRWDREEGAYQKVQSARPQTLAYALNDSPAGLAAWIVEKFRAWSDCDGNVERAFDKDTLLSNLTIYWVTQTIGSSFRPYFESVHNPNPRPWRKVEVPCGIATFPKDLGVPPREWAERSYNVHQWTEMPRGGHFPALEAPELLADDIRRLFRRIRS